MLGVFIMKFKKADGGVTAIIIVVLILIFLGWLVNVGGRECRTNKDCGEDAYCGSDFACHKIPVIEKSSVVVDRHYTIPALIIGVAIILTAVIFKWDKLRPNLARSRNEELQTTAEPVSGLKAP